MRPGKPRDIPVLPGLDHARVVLLHVDLAGDAVGDHVRLGQLVVCGGARARTLWRQESVLQVVVVLGARGLDQTLLQHLLQVRLVVMFWGGRVGGGGDGNSISYFYKIALIDLFFTSPVHHEL